MEAIEAVLAEVRALRKQLDEQKQLPLVVTMKRAAFELSVSLTTLKALVRASVILTVMIGSRRMVPTSELRRCATPALASEQKPRGKPSKRRRVAEEMSLEEFEAKAKKL